MSDEPDMVDEMLGFIQKLYNIPYKRRTFAFLNSIMVLQIVRKTFLVVSVFLMFCLYHFIIGLMQYSLFHFQLIFLAESFQVDSPKDRPATLTQDDKETEDEVNVVDFDEGEDDVANGVGDDAPLSVPEGSSAPVAASAFLPASYQEDEGGRRLFKKSSVVSGSSKRPKLVKTSPPLIMGLDVTVR